MILNQSFVDTAGATWVCAGYKNFRIPGLYGPIYRYIRMTDGARIRLHSNKLYGCSISQRTFETIANTPIGINEEAFGNGAAKLADDHKRVGYYENHNH